MPRLSELPWLVLIWLSHSRLVEGCDVRVADTDGDVDEVFIKVGDALRLIVQHGPRFHARLRRDVKRLLFTDTQGANYLAGLGTCRIGIDYARRLSPLELAMTIVHEATHARLSRAGFEYVRQRRERIERICVGAEVAFAQRVPGSEPAVAKVRELLTTQWWTPERIREATFIELEERGVPTWLTNILRWLSGLWRLQ